MYVQSIALYALSAVLEIRNGAPLHPAPIGAGAARANGNTARKVHGPALATPHLDYAFATIRI